MSSEDKRAEGDPPTRPTDVVPNEPRPEADPGGHENSTTDNPAGQPESERVAEAIASVADDDPYPEESADDDVKVGGGVNGKSILTVMALLTVAGVGLHYIQDVFTPIFLALTIVLAFRPVGRWFIKKGFPSWLASAIMIVVVIGTVLAVVGIVVWSLTPVPQTLMNYSGNFEQTVQSVLNFLQERGIETDDASVYLNQINFNSIVGWAWSLVDSVSSIGGLITIVVVALFFITIDTMVTKSRSAVIAIQNSNLGIALSGFERRVRQYWIVSSIFGLIVAIIDAVVLQFMGVPLAWTWGVWAFITNYIPNIGFVLGVIPPMLMALLDQGWQSMLWVMVLYSVINVVIQTFIQPKFTGDAVGLSPTVTFISLTVWTAIVGILGSILAVPLTLFFKALLVDSDPRTRWIDAFLISEDETERRRREGRYDVDSPADDDFVEFQNPFAQGQGQETEREAPRKRTKLAGLTRQLKNSAKSKK